MPCVFLGMMEHHGEQWLPQGWALQNPSSLKKQYGIGQGSKSQLAKGNPVVYRRCVAGLGWFADLAASLFAWVYKKSKP